MNRIRTLIVAASLLFPCFAASTIAGVSAARLRCEYRTEPLGIGETRPRLSWVLVADDAARGVRQTACQVLVASSMDLLVGDKGDLWDSGKVSTDRIFEIAYAGRTLTSGQECWWKVRVWDEADSPSSWSAPAHWSMGLLSAVDWKAEWIGLDSEAPRGGAAITPEHRAAIAAQRWVYADVPVNQSAPQTAFLRGTFVIPDGRRPVAAVLAVTVDQLCTAWVNGRSAGRISRWEQLEGIDVAGALVPGENVIGLEVSQLDGHPPAALGALILEFADGTTQNVAVDTTWRFSTVAAPGWNVAGLDAASWRAVIDPPEKRNPWDGPPQTFTYWLPPAPQLRKSFDISKPVRRAMVYSTALGVYELHANGGLVGRDVLAPGWTDFNARVQYQTHDITRLLRPGRNVIGALLGDGWYASVLGYTGRRYFYGGYPRFLAQLVIEYEDGTRECVLTDSSWEGSDRGPVRSADLMQGCRYDARLCDEAWASPQGGGEGWRPVDAGLRPLDPKKPLRVFAIEAANADASRVQGELPARRITEPAPGAYTIDFGQNMVGWVRLKVSGRPGQKIMVRHGEMLNPNGTLYTSNLRGANATDVYFLRGGVVEVLEPKFTFHGFRYIEITGLEKPPVLEAVTGVIVHSQMEQTGSFECSSPLVNQLFSNIVWSQKGNYLEVPTDCPQRDERAGWSGDAQFFVGAGVHNFDVAAFLSRWLTTLAVDSQQPDGGVANVAPAFGGLWASPGWGGDAVVLCVYELYRTYGDTRVIARNYDSMSRYLAWLGSERKGGAIRARELGDHLNLGGGADLQVIFKAYQAHITALMAEMAAAIGRDDDAARHAAESRRLKAEFQRDCVLSDGSIKNSSQTGYALAFTMELLAAESRARAAEKFAESLGRFDGHLATGFIGTPRLLPALSEAGRPDLANALLLKETYPSWLFQVKNGATTVWERWDGWTPEKGFQTIAMNSFNHYAFGSVGEYLYRRIGGINAATPGFRSIEIRPVTGRGLDWAKASYNSVSGLIVSSWRIEGGRLTLEVVVPPNTQAAVHVPTATPESVEEGGVPAAKSPGVVFLRSEGGAAVYHVGSGHYRFSAPLPQ